jgi:hypothetical protein
MQYFRFLPDLQSFVENFVGRACPSSQVSASAYSPRLMSEPEPVTAYFVDNWRLRALVRLELYRRQTAHKAGIVVTRPTIVRVAPTVLR